MESAKVEEDIKDLKARLEISQLSTQREAIAKAVSFLIRQPEAITSETAISLPHYQLLLKCLTHSSRPVAEAAIKGVSACTHFSHLNLFTFFCVC